MVQWTVSGIFLLSKYSFRAFKPYLHNEFLKHTRLVLQDIDESIVKEIALRKKLMSDKENAPNDAMVRDSSVMNS